MLWSITRERIEWSNPEMRYVNKAVLLVFCVGLFVVTRSLTSSEPHVLTSLTCESGVKNRLLWIVSDPKFYSFFIGCTFKQLGICS